MKLLHLGPFWEGSTALQRMQAFSRSPGVEVVPLDSGYRVRVKRSVWLRARWKLRWPADEGDENRRLLEVAAEAKPDVVFVESKLIRRSTLRALRRMGVGCLAIYTPDDIMAPHNLTWPVRLSFSEWDVFFTTKSFNVPELRHRGAKRPVLVGKAYDPNVHRPMLRDEVGPGCERYDAVFIGTYERERCQSINRLAEAGFSVAVHGAGWSKASLASGIILGSPVFHFDYTRYMHHGRVALCFLRKINRDLITQRSVEIPAMARPMVSERTVEHDAYFKDGTEYIAFGDDDELVERMRALLKDDAARLALGQAARARCIAGGYSTDDRAKFMLSVLSGP